jgi:hypothetical protein
MSSASSLSSVKNSSLSTALDTGTNDPSSLLKKSSALHQAGTLNIEGATAGVSIAAGQSASNAQSSSSVGTNPSTGTVAIYPPAPVNVYEMLVSAGTFTVEAANTELETNTKVSKAQTILQQDAIQNTISAMESAQNTQNQIDANSHHRKVFTDVVQSIKLAAGVALCACGDPAGARMIVTSTLRLVIANDPKVQTFLGNERTKLGNDLANNTNLNHPKLAADLIVAATVTVGVLATGGLAQVGTKGVFGSLEVTNKLAGGGKAALLKVATGAAVTAQAGTQSYFSGMLYHLDKKLAPQVESEIEMQAMDQLIQQTSEVISKAVDPIMTNLQNEISSACNELQMASQQVNSYKLG